MYYNKTNKSESGFVLVGILVMLSLGLLVTGGLLDSATTNLKTRSFVKTRADQYYTVERTMNRVVAWMQTNSKYIVTPFVNGNFAGNFDTGSPSTGSNAGTHFGVPTLVKMSSTTNSAMLSNNSFFGTASFPTLTHLDTAATLDAVTDFAGQDFGGANARIVMMWAKETDGDYEPIFRVDVVTGNNPDRGVHAFSYIYSSIVNGEPVPGFFGQDFLNLNTSNNTCESYQWSWDGSSWSPGASRSNCTVGADGDVMVESNISGNVISGSGTVTVDPPSGSVSGTTCSGGSETCAVIPPLPTVSTWATYCPGVTTDLTISSDTELTAGCYRDIELNSNKDAIFITEHDKANAVSSSFQADVYYIRHLSIGGGSSHVEFGPDTGGGNYQVTNGKKVTLYIENLNVTGGLPGDSSFNGNELLNTVNAPHQVELVFLGANLEVLLNGTADVSASIIAPNTNVVVNGNFDMYGGIQAKSLDVSGSATLHYDESLGTDLPVTDINFQLKKASQRYR